MDASEIPGFPHVRKLQVIDTTVAELQRLAGITPAAMGAVRAGIEEEVRRGVLAEKRDGERGMADIERDLKSEVRSRVQEAEGFLNKARDVLHGAAQEADALADEAEKIYGRTGEGEPYAAQERLAALGNALYAEAETLRTVISEVRHLAEKVAL